MARPKIEIDARQVELLAGCGCTTQEIAAKVDCSKDTLERRFAAVLQKGRERGKSSLRAKQFDMAMKGSVPMLIWLGKQLLGQSDKQEISGPDGGAIAIKHEYEQLRKLPPDELIRMHRQALGTLADT